MIAMTPGTVFLQFVLGTEPFVPVVIDGGLLDACGAKPSLSCEAMWNWTENRLLARGADWFVTRPVLALVILGVAALVNTWLRRLVTEVITRVATRDRYAMAALQKIGVGAPSALTITDPRTSRRTKTLATVARALVSGFIGVITVLMVLGVFNIELGPLLAGAGIAGIAVGLGAQSLVRDCIAGFFIILEDQFGVGDDVDLGQASGTVESITLRATTLRSCDGTLWSVPNGAIIRVGNQSKIWSNAVLDVTVWFEADIDAALEIMDRVATEVCERTELAPMVQEPPSVLGADRFTAEGVVLRVVVRTSPGAQWRLMRELRKALKTEFEASGVPLFRPSPGS